jgi:GxxExxY protein
LKKYYVPDFLGYGKIVVEIKAEKHLTTVDEAQLINQLKVTFKELGLLINFGTADKLEWARRVFTDKHNSNRDKFMSNHPEE